MSKSVILGILFTVLILSLPMVSCVESESNFWSTYIPKSGYPVDIIGYVTIADKSLKTDRKLSCLPKKTSGMQLK